MKDEEGVGCCCAGKAKHAERLGLLELFCSTFFGEKKVENKLLERMEQQYELLKKFEIASR